MSSSKDASILRLLDALSLDLRGWAVNDNWEADLCAIGIAKQERPQRLVYVSTYGKKPGRYDYECEDAREDQAVVDYVIVDRGKDVDFQTLLEAMERHLT